MPLISSDYDPPILFRNTHIATIYSGTIRKVNGLTQIRETIPTPDDDFMDLDWSYAYETTESTTDRLIVILHGLEGNAQRPYITGVAKIFNKKGFDACAMNFRGCSGTPNKLFRSYHSGVTEDLACIIDHITANHSHYRSVVLFGFSLGANVTLKYLGETSKVPDIIKAAVAVSAPCDLYDAMLELHKPVNFLYALRFKMNLIEKLKIKKEQFPELVSDADIKSVHKLRDFDEVYTSRAHNFKDAEDYYRRASSLPVLENINIPALLLNATNDSFLGMNCYPIEIARKNPFLFLEMPEYGGHVGFFEKGNIFFNEQRGISFISEILSL
ncbi:YheT family hydrolase [Robertkochia solimangrovi]|uniref:YheT family hydrolase n=1 Tax=Robertkochia solimangrovi TaxID=2213046 RepID=UPI0011800FE6|nr:alpha/beta fold hydrolase [Robertkochia solimangrovi]TRZ45861.1 alpha/beta hydrolase [Robertkochia solimangrovi]